MLFILTGDIQTGKTRWLEQLVETLNQNGVPTFGVLAPGHWVPSTSPHANASGYEKLGIHNVLLPTKKRIVFAERLDLAKQNNTYSERAQSTQAELGWHISDQAIAAVNAHFDTLPTTPATPATLPATPPATTNRPGLLVVDELGRLELHHHKGLSRAVHTLKQGPTPAFPHALVVVRNTLVPEATELLQPAWNTPHLIAPTTQSAHIVLNTFTIPQK